MGISDRVLERFDKVNDAPSLESMTPTHDGALRIFADDWQLDGDLLRCTQCGRGLIASRDGEPLSHAAGCKNKVLHPWRMLRVILR
jgi:hypothetical protein